VSTDETPGPLGGPASDEHPAPLGAPASDLHIARPVAGVPTIAGDDPAPLGAPASARAVDLDAGAGLGPVVPGAPPWSRAYQVAVVVSDLDRAVAFYESLGIGPFREGPSAHTVERIVRGVPSPETKVAGRIAQLGPIELELFQPLEGPSIQREFLETRGEGPIHVCAYTDDLQRDVAWMAERGTDVISFGRLSDGGSFAYFDTVAVGGLVLELYELGPDGEQIPTAEDAA
jgi:catechol 2,3-dioxygenase-like lactoylglutathione lyase family enzyme